MHGRVKVRTTEEQKEIARREKQKKAAAFKEAMITILGKRSSGVHDQECLNLTAGVLSGNPDIITLWNYRREILLKMRDETDAEEFQKMMKSDLSLTEQCLKVNPKSYGSWHHRIWILDNSPQPDWGRELLLCTKYLELDERNFHCWDYRKIVAERSKVPDMSEYEFTYKKIETNFSNYSAWHLRSILLQRLFPDEEKKFPINEEKHREELELVENAAFTDPNDQSAWFYLRWLLGLKEPKTSLLYVSADKDEVTVVTSRTIKMTTGDDTVAPGYTLNVRINGEKADGVWTSRRSCQPQSCLWLFKPDSEVQPTDVVSVSLEENGNECEKHEVMLSRTVARRANFLPLFSDNLLEVITNQLSSCQQLIELEPDSKWTLLTSIFLMLSIDRVKYEGEMIGTLDKLCDIDPLRTGYYKDLRSKLIIQLRLMSHGSESATRFSVSGQSLTSMYHSQCLYEYEEIDLSKNNLSASCLSHFYYFLKCKTLNLTGNRIDSLNELPVLDNLETLLVDDNSIRDLDPQQFSNFPRLSRVTLANNPIASGKTNEGPRYQVKNLLGNEIKFEFWS